MQIRLRALRYFIAAAEAGSVSEAASNLNLSQPSISTAIMQIEEDLNVQLFVRLRSKGIRLTPQGSEVLKEARQLMATVEEFRASVDAVNGQMQGDLSFASFLNLGSSYMSDIIATFQNQHPNINVQMKDYNQQEIFDALLSGKVEMAMTFDLNLPSAFDVRYVATKEPFAVLPFGDPLASQEAVSIEDLANRPFILMDLPHTAEYFQSLFQNMGLVPNIRYRTRTFETVRTFVASGLGVSILNLRPDIDATYNGKQVVIRPIKQRLRPLKIVLLRYKRLRSRKIAETFANHIADYFSEER